MSGCATKTVNYQALQTASAEHHSSFYHDTTYYCGTKDKYDYFYVEYGVSDTLSTGKAYRVNSSETPLTNRFPYSDDKGKWEKTTLYLTPSK